MSKTENWRGFIRRVLTVKVAPHSSDWRSWSLDFKTEERTDHNLIWKDVINTFFHAPTPCEVHANTVAQQLQWRFHLNKSVNLVWDQLVMCSMLQTVITADEWWRHLMFKSSLSCFSCSAERCDSVRSTLPLRSVMIQFCFSDFLYTDLVIMSQMKWYLMLLCLCVGDGCGQRHNTLDNPFIQFRERLEGIS